MSGGAGSTRTARPSHSDAAAPAAAEGAGNQSPPGSRTSMPVAVVRALASSSSGTRLAVRT